MTTVETRGGVVLELRPKLAWRVGGPSFLLAGTVLLALGGDWRWVVLLAMTVIDVVLMWRRRIVVQDRTLFVRDGGWLNPVLLDHLKSMELRWSFMSRLPRRVVRLTDQSGASIDVGVSLWSGWRELVALATEYSGLQLTKRRGGMSIKEGRWR